MKTLNKSTNLFCDWHLAHIKDVHSDNQFNSVNDLKEYSKELVFENVIKESIWNFKVMEMIFNEIDFEEIFYYLNQSQE